MDACFVDGELAQSQAGVFYGGWITSNIVGPIKRGAGNGGLVVLRLHGNYIPVILTFYKHLIVKTNTR